MKNLYLFVMFLVMYEFSTYVSNDMIMPGMLSVVNEFHASIIVVSLSFTVFILGNSMLQLFLGPLAERFGKRNLIICGNIFFLGFTIFLALSHTIEQFMLGRLLQGGGLAFISIGYALIHERFNDKESVKIFSLMGNVSLLAPLLGPSLGVIVIQLMGWRYIFAITAALALISFIGLFIFTPKSKPNNNIRLNVGEIAITYLKIFLKPKFLLGSLCISLSTLPIIAWIGLAPTIVIKALHLSMLHYALYQLIAVGGLSVSSIVMHQVTGKISFQRLKPLHTS